MQPAVPLKLHLPHGRYRSLGADTPEALTQLMRGGSIGFRVLPPDSGATFRHCLLWLAPTASSLKQIIRRNLSIVAFILWNHNTFA